MKNKIDLFKNVIINDDSGAYEFVSKNSELEAEVFFNPKGLSALYIYRSKSDKIVSEMFIRDNISTGKVEKTFHFDSEIDSEEEIKVFLKDLIDYFEISSEELYFK